MNKTRIILLIVATVIAVAIAAYLIKTRTSLCANTSIEMQLDGLANKQVLISRSTGIDSLVTNEKSKLVYKFDLPESEPELVNVYYNNREIASLMVQKGEKVVLSADSLGNYVVSNSPESVKLQQIDKNREEVLSQLQLLSKDFADTKLPKNERQALERKIRDIYVNYYRSSIKYVFDNIHSLSTVVLVLSAKNNQLPIFNRPTDVFLLKQLADSLRTLYPKSVYLNLLDARIASLDKSLNLEQKMSEAKELSYFDIVAPNLKGEEVLLSEVKAPVIMLYFWGLDNNGKMNNIDVLKPIYDKYHSKGFEIYSVCIANNKADWAKVVRNQNLGWINVCDGLGLESVTARLYNIKSLPVSYFIVDNQLLLDNTIKDEKSLRAYLDKKLK